VLQTISDIRQEPPFADKVVRVFPKSEDKTTPDAKILIGSNWAIPSALEHPQQHGLSSSTE